MASSPTSAAHTSTSPTTQTTSQCAYMLPTLREKLHHNPHLKLLDVGCGTGSLTISLAQLLPQGQATGVDISGAALESAKVYAEMRGVGNVPFLKADAHSLPFADGAFDVVCTHQAVAHFCDRVRGIRELARVTRKGGGVLCMREGDLGSARFEPRDAVLEECFRVVVDVHAGSGGAPDAGRRLEAWTLQAGVPRSSVVATQSACVYSTAEERRNYGGHWPQRCANGVFADRAVEMGVTRARLEDYAKAWRRWIDDENGRLTMMHGEVIARM